jgi:hypothetical protein
LCIGHPPFAATVCDVAADLIRGDYVTWPGQVLRARNAGAPVVDSISNGFSVRLVMDGENRDCLFNYLDDSSDQLLVFSDKITARQDPLLHDKLLRSARALASKGKLHVHFSNVDGDEASILNGLTDAGTIIVEDGLNHIKALVSDRARALVTSFNVLSFSGRSSKRSSAFEVGIEIRPIGAIPDLLANLVSHLLA